MIHLILIGLGVLTLGFLASLLLLGLFIVGTVIGDAVRRRRE